MDEIKLTLTVNEVNLILTALGDKPYAQVFQVIGRIQQQAQLQLNPEPPASAHPHNHST